MTVCFDHPRQLLHRRKSKPVVKKKEVKPVVKKKFDRKAFAALSKNLKRHEDLGCYLDEAHKHSTRGVVEGRRRHGEG